MVNRCAALRWQALLRVTSRTKEPNHPDDIEERIIRSLFSKPRSSISEIARELSVNRSTASKYLYVLKAKRRIDFRQVGPVKLWSLEDP